MNHLACVNCGDPIESAEGIIDLDENGLCDCCRERQERMAVLADDIRRSGDHDCSMNW